MREKNNRNLLFETLCHAKCNVKIRGQLLANFVAALVGATSMRNLHRRAVQIYNDRFNTVHVRSAGVIKRIKSSCHDRLSHVVTIMRSYPYTLRYLRKRARKAQIRRRADTCVRLSAGYAFLSPLRRYDG